MERGKVELGAGVALGREEGVGCSDGAGGGGGGAECGAAGLCWWQGWWWLSTGRASLGLRVEVAAD